MEDAYHEDPSEKGPNFEQKKWEEEHMSAAILKFGAKDAKKKKKEKDYDYVLDEEIAFIQAPTLEMNYKSYPDGSKRYMEHWMEGGVNGVYTNGNDKRVFNWRSEYNLITRGANRHVVGRG